MPDKKSINEGYQPLQKGYQPNSPKVPTDGKVQGGYQPPTGETKPVNPPPKKP